MGLGTLESEYSANRSVKRIRTESIRVKATLHVLSPFRAVAWEQLFGNRRRNRPLDL